MSRARFGLDDEHRYLPLLVFGTQRIALRECQLTYSLLFGSSETEGLGVPQCLLSWQQPNGRELAQVAVNWPGTWIPDTGSGTLLITLEESRSNEASTDACMHGDILAQPLHEPARVFSLKGAYTLQIGS